MLHGEAITLHQERASYDHRYTIGPGMGTCVLFEAVELHFGSVLDLKMTGLWRKLFFHESV